MKVDGAAIFDIDLRKDSWHGARSLRKETDRNPLESHSIFFCSSTLNPASDDLIRPHVNDSSYSKSSKFCEISIARRRGPIEHSLVQSVDLQAAARLRCCLPCIGSIRKNECAESKQRESENSIIHSAMTLDCRRRTNRTALLCANEGAKHGVLVGRVEERQRH